MGRYIGYAILIAMVAFVLNWFSIVHFSFLDLPDVEEENRIELRKSANALELLD